MRSLSNSPSLLALALLAFIGTSLFVSPVQADWLILDGGERIETKGEWQVEDGRVIYFDAQGQLVSIAVEDVDLEASREALTAAASEESAENQGTKQQGAVLTLTDSDVAKAGSDQAEADEISPIILYSTSWCGWCRKTRSLLIELGATYVEKDIEKDPAGKQEYIEKAGAGAGVPVLDYKGQVVRGYSEGTIRGWVAEMKAEASSK